mmetsp:Transcript_92033/g.286894  ORF Transcript_92033/g.286894 Transcript_92033/m.286894 type:complete len:239 (-) Transcript_92033:23-739(-)
MQRASEAGEAAHVAAERRDLEGGRGHPRVGRGERRQRHWRHARPPALPASRAVLHERVRAVPREPEPAARIVEVVSVVMDGVSVGQARPAELLPADARREALVAILVLLLAGVSARGASLHGKLPGQLREGGLPGLGPLPKRRGEGLHAAVQRRDLVRAPAAREAVAEPRLGGREPKLAVAGAPAAAAVRRLVAAGGHGLDVGLGAPRCNATLRGEALGKQDHTAATELAGPVRATSP